ncbi:MAG: T9SS type A sorting domain-containing protein [Elusimicrobiota bacterium]
MRTLLALVVLATASPAFSANVNVLERMYEMYTSSTTPENWKYRLRDEMETWTKARELPEPASPSGGTGTASIRSQAQAPRGNGLTTMRALGFFSQESAGAVRLTDGSGVVFPKDSLSKDVLAMVAHSPDIPESTIARKRAEQKLASVSDAVEFGPSGTVFLRPVDIALAYDPAMLQIRGLTARDLKVYHWNEVRNVWEALASTVDESARLVRAQTTHFSVFQVMGSGGIGVQATGAYGFVDAYAFPNPARGVKSVTIRTQVGNADELTVRIYDLSGKRVHSTQAGAAVTLDDGNGKGAQPTYDVTWDISGIGSGVYNYAITAKRAGEADIRKTGKIAVIK